MLSFVLCSTGVSCVVCDHLRRGLLEEGVYVPFSSTRTALAFCSFCCYYDVSQQYVKVVARLLLQSHAFYVLRAACVCYCRNEEQMNYHITERTATPVLQVLTTRYHSATPYTFLRRCDHTLITITVLIDRSTNQQINQRLDRPTD